jgi:hypothetical protein
MRRASPTITLQEIGRQLQAMAIPSARGHLTWSASMVAQLLKPTQPVSASEGKADILLDQPLVSK